MPYVLAFNRPAIEARIARLAGYLGFAGGFDGFQQAVLALREALAVPHTVAGLNVDASREDLIAEMAIVDPTAGGNPVPLTKDAALTLFRNALAGTL
ncbi:MAG: iron-containing alcohol dehydrogenase, partial [Geminicoccaceae bacterium]|nr:iron-containing alcohol dehydrogenase [Geminicoccaceae bacterium]